MSSLSVTNSIFKINRQTIENFFSPKNLDLLNLVGGIEGLYEELRTDPTTGLTQDILYEKERQKYFGRNELPPVPVTPIWKIMWNTLLDPTLILLSVAAVISLGLGIYEDLATNAHITLEHDDNGNPFEIIRPRVQFVEGLAILIAVIIVVLVSSINDFQKEKQFQMLNKKKEGRDIKVLRDGKMTLISVYDVMVGDIVHLEPGDILSTDGVLIRGNDVKCDDSQATGESDSIKKSPYQISWLKSIPRPTPDPFLYSGSKVLQGRGEYLAVAVGKSSFFGRIMMNLREETEETPLQVKLSKLALLISKIGLVIALLNLVVLLIIYFAGWSSRSHEASDILKSIIKIIISSITILVIAVPEGLPLAVTLSLAFATIRMLKDNNLVRTLVACETMGNATTVCSDKTGTLTTNTMTVVSGTIGKDLNFDHRSSSDSIIIASNLVQSLSKKLINLIQESICINSTAFQTGNADIWVGCKTESALIKLTLNWTSFNLLDLRHRYPVAKAYPFSSDLKFMSTLIELPDNKGEFRLLIKGAPEILIEKSTKIVNIESEELDQTEFSKFHKTRINDIIVEYAQKSLRTIALAYTDIKLTESQLKEYESLDAIGKSGFWSKLAFNNQPADLSNQLTWIGIFGIQDPLREGVVEAVKACKRSGVVVRMVTGDNILTARAIAKECGILTSDGIALEGPRFRELSEEDMDSVIPKLQVLARSSPQDKMLLVKKLKSLGEVVAVTGDGTNDGPALKAADIGFSMGISGTEVAKEASSIVLMDDNFASIVKAIMWGRMVNDSIKKFIQFQLTINFSAILIAFVSSIISPNGSVFSAVQLLWVNLIMDTLAALALATDFPDSSILDRPPDRRDSALISPTMWKMILVQSMAQVIICFSLLYGGYSLVPRLRKPNVTFNQIITDDTLGTIVFNTFVLLQVFNEINCRVIDNKLNVFKNFFKNYYFLTILVGTFALQVLIVEFGDVAFSTTPLGWQNWLICIGIGFISLPLGFITRLIPVETWLSGKLNIVRKFELRNINIDEKGAEKSIKNSGGHSSVDKTPLLSHEDY
ncbi:calcium-translocating P-type ATPase [Conidiobolus coronatus NRRL 28638]|uniref:Calcium-transporting ATPase n=1 Tax=Conidiobolus coronatus (strain ATCC 28846 / CBS 209.66 / NRRL 28638) TaxID=796925 RepID=A0A137NTZ5_CONC2|nr:calcium-translocating P-type ATPase [Conidiobolus coronatus NRRL 28638]|eukprot:KXN66247.1 calcium-translocating P-type ATPase [Conidiobolus coronatus NRRL 28638]